jgi:putative membrane protein
MSVNDLPALNALLNGTSAVLLAFGYASIRRRQVAAHRALMIAAFSTSTLFLASYLVHKAFGDLKPFSGQGWIRPVYFSILLTHTVLAAAIVPLAIMTLRRGLKARHPAHERLARWTLPLWFYVSVTGVVIYFLLYRMYPNA